MKKLKFVINVLQWILIIFSVMSFLIALIEGFTCPFDFSIKGYQAYLSLFQPYSIIFASTFVVITSNLAIERLGIMNQANINSFKANNRTQWIQVVREFFHEIKDDDPYLVKELIRNLLSIHDYLFEKNYRISNQSELKDFFNKFFASKIASFEQVNRQYLNISLYKDEKHSYSWMNFRYLLFAMINIDDSYENFLGDFEILYLEKVLDFSKDKIDENGFLLSVKEHNDRKRSKIDIR